MRVAIERRASPLSEPGRVNGRMNSQSRRAPLSSRTSRESSCNERSRVTASVTRVCQSASHAESISTDGSRPSACRSLGRSARRCRPQGRRRSARSARASRSARVAQSVSRDVEGETRDSVSSIETVGSRVRVFAASSVRTGPLPRRALLSAARSCASDRGSGERTGSGVRDEVRGRAARAGGEPGLRPPGRSAR